MRKKHYPKSALFLVELLINILLFSFLCGCGLLFFMKSQKLTQDATALHNGVRIVSSLAAIYESGDGSLDQIPEVYPQAICTADSAVLYFDADYACCREPEASYRVHIQILEGAPDKAEIDFYDDKEVLYSIRACYLSPTTLKEVNGP